MWVLLSICFAFALHCVTLFASVLVCFFDFVFFFRGIFFIFFPTQHMLFFPFRSKNKPINNHPAVLLVAAPPYSVVGFGGVAARF